VIRRARSAAEYAAAAVAAFGAAATCFAQPLPAGVDECLARIAQQRVAELPAVGPDDAAAGELTGPPRLGDVCPELALAINEGAWGEALVDASAEDLSWSAFEELARLVASYERPAQPPGQALSPESLDDVLAALELREPETELTLWQRIRKWFDEQLGSRDSRAGRWIEDWLGNLSVPERVVRLLLIVLGAVLVIATAAVVVNELRIAGVLAGGALRKYSPLARAATNEARVSDFDDIARAPLARRPGLLLLLVLDRLRARGKAPLRDSLTHRELVAAAHGLSVEQSDALRTVATAAEHATFGGWRPDERDVDDVVARGRALVASLADERGDEP
jgi:hypothetical protein